MNEKITNQIAEMKKQTIGVEVEMNNITREKAARIAAKFFGTGRYENTAGRNGYYTWSAWDEQGREWKFQKDVSIQGIDSEKCELVTPILKYEDIEKLQVLRFDSYSEEWAKFILANRNNSSANPVHDFDVVIGPIADDRVGLQLWKYETHSIDLPTLVKNLRYMKGVTMQYFFGTDRAINLLRKI